MALSDYEAIGFDKSALNIYPTFKYGNFELELYKTWCYVKNKKLFNKKNGFDSPTFACIDSGHMNIDQVDIYAKEFKSTETHGRGTFFLFSNYAGRGKNIKKVWRGGIACCAYKSIKKALVNKFKLSGDIALEVKLV